MADWNGTEVHVETEARQRLVRVAQGQEPADLLIRGARVVNVLTREIYEADVAVAAGRIAAVGSGYRAAEVLEARGAYLAPGFIDAHIHIESSLLTPARFAQVARPRGTTTVVAEPHELVNVLGLAGLHWMLEAGRGSGIRVYASLPSCVPASEYELGGAVLSAADIRAGLRVPGVLGLAEMMNYPGVLGLDAGVWEVLAETMSTGGGRRRDGHAAGLSGRELQAYAAAGIHSDHEAVTPAEAQERLRAGMWLMVREGSAARNLQALLPVLRGEMSGERPPRRAMLVSDDVGVDELLRLGHLDRLMRECVAGGLHPADALALVTCNPAEYWGLHDLGVVAPGYHADLVLLEDLNAFRVLETFVGGERHFAPQATPALSGGAVHLGSAWDTARLTVPDHWPVIGVRPDQIVTDRLTRQQAQNPAEGDLNRLVVADRYGRGETSACWAAGIGLTRGAVALSVLHDAHHVIVAGTGGEAGEASIRAAGRALERLGGGVVVHDGVRVIAQLPLPYAGLMTDADPQLAAAQVEAVTSALHTLGCVLPYPVTTLSFLGLSVIPSLKLTPRGLLDVEKWALVSREPV
jgi:adenine deaminase